MLKYIRCAARCAAALALATVLPLSCGNGGDGTTAAVQAGTSGATADSGVVAFASAFDSAPVVVASGQWNSAAWLAAAKSAGTASFTLAFSNPSGGAAVTDPFQTWVQYIAIIPDPDSADLAAATAAAADGATITFATALSGIPAVICSAVDAEGTPLFANPSNIASGSFVIHLTDMSGAAASGTLSYIAMVPASSPLAVSGKTLYAGSSTIDTGAPSYPDLAYGTALSADPAALLCSPYREGAAAVATTHTLGTTQCACSVQVLSGGVLGDLAGTADLHWLAVVD